MACSTVTGCGPGSSFGKMKPDNNCGGCSCSCGKKDHEEEIETYKIGCYTRDRVGGRIVSVSSSLSPSIRVCS